MNQRQSPSATLSVVLPGLQSPDDRRRARRFSCNWILPVVLHLPTASRKIEGWVRNLSETGIGLTIAEPLEVGDTLVVRLRGAQSRLLTVPARVTYATAKDDGTWSVGCGFDRRLDPQVLRSLV